MRFDILTLFPDMFPGVVGASILKRAQAAGALEVHMHDIRAVARDVHRTVDDTPYGGGAGMVLKVDIVDAALQQVLNQVEVSTINPDHRRIILFCPQGKRLEQKRVRQLAQLEQLTLVCGHYEGYDERIRSLVDEELSIGDYILTGGELPAMVLIDCLARLQPGVIHANGPIEESFSLTDEVGNELLEYPHYTRPLEYNGTTVPDVLRSGNHAAIKAWRLEQAKLRTHAHTQSV
jgi:tRNA (guanine37-N1)-methyltransferase